MNDINILHATSTVAAPVDFECHGVILANLRTADEIVGMKNLSGPLLSADFNRRAL